MKTIVTVTGASGIGKDSLVDALLYFNGVLKSDHLRGIAKSVTGMSSRIPKKMRKLIGYTTRKPRDNESNGKPHYFVSEAEFDRLNKIEEVEYSGAKYCYTSEEIQKIPQGGFGIVIASQDAVRQFRSYATYADNVQVVSFFLESDEEIIRGRMKERGDSEQQIADRIKHAEQTEEYHLPDSEKNKYVILSPKMPFTELVELTDNVLSECTYGNLDEEIYTRIFA